MTTLTFEDVASARAERTAIYRVAYDMVDKGLDPGLIAAYMREEERRHPAAFVTDWTPFVTCMCGSRTDEPTWLGLCSPECDDLEVLWAQLAACLRASVTPPPVVVTRGNMDRPDVRVMPLTGPQAGWQ